MDLAWPDGGITSYVKAYELVKLSPEEAEHYMNRIECLRNFQLMHTDMKLSITFGTTKLPLFMGKLDVVKAVESLRCSCKI